MYFESLADVSIHAKQPMTIKREKAIGIIEPCLTNKWLAERLEMIVTCAACWLNKTCPVGGEDDSVNCSDVFERWLNEDANET